MSPILERISCNWSEDSIRFMVTPSPTAKATYFYVQEVGYFKTMPPYFTERANLNSFLIVYTISGMGRLCYDNQEYMLKPRQAFFIHCINHHYYECAGPEWEMVWVHFNGNQALGYYDIFAQNGFRPITFEDSDPIENRLQKLLALNVKKDLHSEILSSNLLVNLLTEFLVANSAENLPSTIMPPYLQKLARRLDQNFGDTISLDDLAEQFCISKYHMSREFKKYMGITIHEYQTQNRMNYAKELLKYSDLPVNDIAFACGYHQTSHFINLFRDRELTTPSCYRKEWQSFT